ncbi:hypothetical protein Afil01_10280 [Actinorhabdospora filicis]|uniref:Uncharacterized protein n=1 Tax=Actinorhabdospora filicis TaxID=1785913 RepID=A0A9W6W886_9ACTN|nr:hypothetical protein [Actinorhabdospora filicis]GLZ76221.1 hypothetical protein Afil01_10280 [Actinorhabdospora filicis]
MTVTPRYGVDYIADIERLNDFASSDRHDWALAGNGEEAWRVRLRHSVSALRDAFFAHVAASESPGGLYREVCETSPRLARRVAELRRDSARIGSAINLLLVRSAHARPDWVRRWCADLAAQLTRHREEGADLLHQAYFSDLGGET